MGEVSQDWLELGIESDDGGVAPELDLFVAHLLDTSPMPRPALLTEVIPEPVVVEAAVQPAPDDNWLEIADGDDTGVKSAVTLPYDAIRFSCMRGTNRVWACDGEYVAYRPYNREFDKEVNPRTAERHADFIASGNYKFVGTFDEVQIFKLLEGSPFKTVRKNYVVGRDYWSDIRQAAQIACRREWIDFHDFLEAMAGGIKANRSPGFAIECWNDALNQIHINIKHRNGPTPAECAAGVQNVRKARGHRTHVLITPTSGVLAEAQKIQYER